MKGDYLSRWIHNSTVLTRINCYCTICVLIYPIVQRTLHEIASPLNYIDVILVLPQAIHKLLEATLGKISQFTQVTRTHTNIQS